MVEIVVVVEVEPMLSVITKTELVCTVSAVLVGMVSTKVTEGVLVTRLAEAATLRVFGAAVGTPEEL